MIDWKYIIIHHSATNDQKVNDWEAIRKYHTSWRLNGNIITEEKGRELQNMGEYVEAPWRDIGYHYGFEYEDGKLYRRLGRSLEISGAHTIGMNTTGIGVCLVGNYDLNPPTDEMLRACAKLCAELAEQYQIEFRNIYGHFNFATKTCPGRKFPWARFMEYVFTAYGNGDN